MKLSQKTCPRNAHCFLRSQERYVPVSARARGEAYFAGYIGEESDISCFHSRTRTASVSPGAVRASADEAGVRKGYARAG